MTAHRDVYTQQGHFQIFFSGQIDSAIFDANFPQIVIALQPK